MIVKSNTFCICGHDAFCHGFTEDNILVSLELSWCSLCIIDKGYGHRFKLDNLKYLESIYYDLQNKYS